MIGSLRSERLVAPRIRMRDPVPVVPPLCITSTPGTRELRRSAAFVGKAACATLAASIEPMLFPFSRFNCSCPVADTMIASSGTAAVLRAKSSVAVSPAATVAGCVVVANPINRTCTLYRPGGTFVMLYRPSRLVRPCRLVPTMSTEAPDTGCWFDLSVTCPATMPCWACTGSATTPASSRIAAALPSNWRMRNAFMERVLIQRVLERDPAGARTSCSARGAAR